MTGPVSRRRRRRCSDSRMQPFAFLKIAGLRTAPRTTSHRGGVCAGPTNIQPSSRPARNAADPDEPRPRRYFGQYRHLRASIAANRARQSGGSLLANNSPSPPTTATRANHVARRQRDRAAREGKAAIGEFNGLDARGRCLQLGLAGKRIGRRRHHVADARMGGGRVAPVDRRENRTALLAVT